MEMKVPVAPKIAVLLETTIQIHRIVDDPDIKDRINGELADKIVYTTTFVLREFLRTIISDVRFILSMTEKLENAGISDGILALSRLSQMLAQGIGNFSPRAPQRQYYVVAAILQYFGVTRVSIQELKIFLIMVAQQWLVEFFEIPISGNSYTNIRETCLCTLDESPEEIYHWIKQKPIPLSPPFPKGAAEFLQVRRIHVHEVEKSFERQKAKYKDVRLLDVLSSVKTKEGEYDFENKLQSRRSWALGDLLITLETPLKVFIYTTDRHYDVLCNATGRRQHTGYLPRKSRT
jgi:hypothetical protein